MYEKTYCDYFIFNYHLQADFLISFFFLFKFKISIKIDACPNQIQEKKKCVYIYISRKLEDIWKGKRKGKAR